MCGDKHDERFEHDRPHHDDVPHHHEQGDHNHQIDDLDDAIAAGHLRGAAQVAFPRRLLNENETVVLDLRPHWWVLAGSVTLLALSLALAIVVSVAVAGAAHDAVLIAALVLVLVALARFVRRYARWATTNMVLTSDRLILRAGVFAKTGREIPLERINDLTYRQRLFERLIGAGDLLVESAGERGQETLRMVPNPMQVQQAIYKQMAQAGANRRGSST